MIKIEEPGDETSYRSEGGVVAAVWRERGERREGDEMLKK